MLRQNDLKDLRRRDELASARAELKKNSMMLYTSSLVSRIRSVLQERQRGRVGWDSNACGTDCVAVCSNYTVTTLLCP